MASWPYCTTQWKKLRKAKLAHNPLCEICERRGLLVEAVAVDHFVPINRGGPAFPALAGLLALCEGCHNEKTSRFDKPGGAAFRRRFQGFDAEGNPIDPFDAWHGEGASQGRGSPSSGTGGNPARLFNRTKD